MANNPNAPLSGKVKIIAVLVAVLIVATLGLFFTAGKGQKAEAGATAKTEAEDKIVIAKVNGKPVYRPEIVQFVEALPPQVRAATGDRLYPMALEQVVNAEIVQQKADKTNTAKDPEVEKRLEMAKEEIVRAVFLEKEIEKKLSDARLKKAYDAYVKEQDPQPQVMARHILVEDEAKAKEIISKLDGGAKFEDLAKEFSTDPTGKATGGSLGWFSKKDMVPDFAKAAFNMKKGEVSHEPVKTQFGWHVIEVQDQRVKPVPEFDEIKEALAVQERRKILEETIKQWRDSAKVSLYDLEGKPLKAEKAKK